MKNFAEQLAETTEVAMKENAKRIANKVASQLIDQAAKGFFKSKFRLSDDKEEERAFNGIVITREFCDLIEDELDGVRARGEICVERGLLGRTTEAHFLIFEWD